MFPEGWDEEQVQRVIAHHDGQDDEAAAAEDAAAIEPAETVISVPRDLLPEIRQLLAKYRR